MLDKIELDFVVTRNSNDPIDYRTVVAKCSSVNLIEVPMAPSVQLARKAIVKYGTAKYVTWFDPDDELYEHTLPRMIRALNSNPSVPGILTPVDRRYRSGAFRVGNKYGFMRSPADAHMMRIFRRDWLLQHFGMFDYPISEWTITAHALVSGAIILPFSGYCWNVGDGDHTKRSKTDIQLTREVVKHIIGDKYHEIFQEIRK